ncbi:DUF1499 domain-containing protein [Vannielia litorea]|uniref:DUF1499 domain-containing protein n=1 Tax=Vannielia litorea TaxID=1217970 RepID=UPI001BCBB31A|nr:DUF1499 domain-containing protein [Vannielia litorea]
MLKWAVVALVALFLGAMAWVRLAPLPEARLEAEPGPDGPGWHDLEGGVKLVIPGAPKDAEARLKAVALADDSTVSPREGTYVTRSLIWRFPDITRVWRDSAGALHVHAHLVFGRSDLGVNRRRLERWIAEAGLGAGKS